MSLCPDNSTECLLRALLEVNSGFNWDVANLAITAIIGVLATGVTFIMLVQGIFTAGPGRLRGSPGAIGEFAQFTQTRFSWSELRIRTRAKVPFLTFQASDHHPRASGVLETPSQPVAFPKPGSPTPPESRERHDGDAVLECDDRVRCSSRCLLSMIKGWLLHVCRNLWLSVATANSKIYQRALYGRDSSLHSYAAGWAKLLAEFEDSLDAWGPNSKDSFVLDCDVDYGPSDLSAAPAMGSVQAIVILAVWAGCDRLTLDDNGYPVATGSFMQLSFRNHHQLGWCAIFDRFPGPGMGIILDTQDWDWHIFSSSVHSSARFEHLEDEERNPQRNLNPVYASLHFRTTYELLQRNPRWRRAIPYRSMGIRWVAVRLARCSKAWRTLEVAAIADRLADYARTESMSICWEPVLNARSRSVWPSEDKQAFMEGDFLLGKSFDSWWWQQRVEIPFSKHFPSRRYDNQPCPPLLQRLCDCEHEPGQCESIQSPSMSKVESEEDDVLIPGPFRVLQMKRCAITMCIRYIEVESILADLPREYKSACRKILRLQIDWIDQYLSWGVYDRAENMCHRLMVEAGGLPRSCKSDLSDAKPSWTDEELSRDRSESERRGVDLKIYDKDIDDDGGLRLIIIFRAILVAAFYSTSVDISCVVHTDLGNRIVHFI